MEPGAQVGGEDRYEGTREGSHGEEREGAREQAGGEEVQVGEAGSLCAPRHQGLRVLPEWTPDSRVRRPLPTPEPPHPAPEGLPVTSEGPESPPSAPLAQLVTVPGLALARGEGAGGAAGTGARGSKREAGAELGNGCR